MQIESHGLDAVPSMEQKSNGTDLFIIWAGASLCFPAFIIGALLVPAFSWYEALIINLLGNLLVGILIVLGGYFGIQTGNPAVILGRKVFGYLQGQWIYTLAILLSMLGWAAVIIAMTGIALNTLVMDLTGFSSPACFIMLIGILNATTAVSGYQNIRRLSSLTVPFMTVVCCYAAVRMLSIENLSGMLAYPATDSMSYGAGLNLIIGGSISGALIASDFSRYTASIRHNWYGTLSGVFLVSFLLGLMGMLSQATTGNWNPLLMVQNAHMGIVVFLFMLVANWTSNDNLLYSSGLALSNVLPSLGRFKNTLICAAAATILAVIGISSVLQQWLEILSCVLAPLLGVVLTDFFIIKSKTANYSINKSAIIAVIVGILMAGITPVEYIPSASGLLGSGLVYLTFVSLSKRRNKC